jgi:hypothetical protein
LSRRSEVACWVGLSNHVKVSVQIVGHSKTIALSVQPVDDKSACRRGASKSASAGFLAGTAHALN